MNQLKELTELTADLRSRINPLYAAQLGTESYERRLCAEAIEGLIVEVERVIVQYDLLMEQTGELRAKLAAYESRPVALWTEPHYGLIYVSEVENPERPTDTAIALFTAPEVKK